MSPRHHHHHRHHDRNIIFIQPLYKRAWSTLRNATFPVPPLTWPAFVVTVLVFHQTGVETLAGYPQLLAAYIGCELLCQIICASLVWYMMVVVNRSIITACLYYKGWLNESTGKPSIVTKLFMGLIAVLHKCKPTFHSFQGLMPARPLPNVARTVELYLASVRPTVSDEEYNTIVQMADEFVKNHSKKIQLRLIWKWMTSPSYVDDWWKTYAYMQGRESLLHTNFGGTDLIFKTYTHNQAARVANIIVMVQLYIRDVFKHSSAKPVTMGGLPMCSNQYIDILEMVRVPKVGCDEVEYVDTTSDYVVIWYKNVFYKLPIIHNNKCLKPYALQKAIENIMANPQQAQCDEEGKMGALTTANRDEYAAYRTKFLSHGRNKECVNMMQNAKQVIFLSDDNDPQFDMHDSTFLEKQYKLALGCDGYMLWMDRPVTIVVNKQGKYRTNCEHGVADALIVCHIIEVFKYCETYVKEYFYDEKGDCIDQQIDFVPDAECLRWSIDDELRSTINKCLGDAREIIDDIDLASIIFTDYGKDHMKAIGVSPDAYIQMALQLAYFKDQSKFELTYESALSRLYNHGRTETVRSCTAQSCDFVRSMSNPDVTRSDRLRLLKIACENHQRLFKASMAGDACDRHLFAMYIVAKYLNIDSPFLTKAVGTGWKLSTSQTPQHQVPELIKVLNAEPELLWPAGAFTCPSKSNYGVCYTVGAGGNHLSFNISTWKHLKNTSAARFRDIILESLAEMQALSLQTPRPSLSNIYERENTVYNASINAAALEPDDDSESDSDSDSVEIKAETNTES